MVAWRMSCFYDHTISCLLLGMTDKWIKIMNLQLTCMYRVSALLYYTLQLPTTVYKEPVLGVKLANLMQLIPQKCTWKHRNFSQASSIFESLEGS